MRKILATYLLLTYSLGAFGIDIPGGENCDTNAPCASTVTLDVEKNEYRVVLPATLSVNLDGTEFLYFELVDRPKHGTLNLEFDGMYKYGEWSRDLKVNNIPKFGPTLQLKYSADRDFLGQDPLTYYVYDKKGRRSNLGKIVYNVVPFKPEVIRVAPIVFSPKINNEIRKTIRIDRNAITFHPSGERLNIILNTKDTESTLRQTDHGIIDAYMNYVSKEEGTDEITFKVSAPSTPDVVSTGKLTFVNKGEPYRSRLGGYKDYLNSLRPEERDSEIVYVGCLLAVIFSVSWVVFAWVLGNLDKNLSLILTVGLSVATFHFGSHVYFRTGRYAISGLFFWALLPGVFAFYFPKAFKKVSSFAFKFLNGYGLTFLMLTLLNGLAYFFHKRSVTFGEICFDSLDYIGLYNNFKYGILDIVGIDHYQRILTPYLAALLPTANSILAFKLVNLFFMNLAVIAMTYLWQQLRIKTYLIILAFSWLFLHQFGLLRFSNFWATNVDSGSLFFAALIAIVIAKDKLWWLVPVMPIASLQRNSFPIMLMFFLVWRAVEDLRKKKPASEVVWGLLPIVLGIVTAKAAAVIPSYVVPTDVEQYYTIILLNALVIVKTLEGDPLLVMRSLEMIFSNYGGFLIAALVYGFNNVKGREKFTSAFWAMNVASLILILLLNTDREIFLAYPFFMTALLVAINGAPEAVLLTSIMYGIPRLGLYIDFPFAKTPPMNSGSATGDVAGWAAYWIIGWIIIKAFYQNLYLKEESKRIITEPA